MAIIYKNVGAPNGSSVTVVNPLANSSATMVTWNSPAAGARGASEVGSFYSLIPSVSVTNPVGATTYSVFSGTLPLGTSLNTSTGIVSGTLSPYARGYAFTIRATNNGIINDRQFTGQVYPSFTGQTIAWNSPAGQGTFIGGTSYSFTPNYSLTGSERAPTTTYSLVSGTLPAGTSLNTSTGVISGTLTNANSSYAFTLRVTNFYSADRQFTGTVAATVYWNSPASALGSLAGGSAFSFISSVSVPNPFGSTTYSVFSGALPAGTSLNTSTGVISGTLTNTSYSFNFWIRATNNGRTSDRQFSGNVVATISWNNGGALGSLVGGSSFSFTPSVSVTNPVGATTYSLVSGKLPAGTSLNTSTGVISGTLTNQAANYSFTLRATNNGRTGDTWVTATVVAKSNTTMLSWISPSAGSLGSSARGSSFSFTSSVSVSNPFGGTTYSLSSGTLPVGTSLNTSTGVISGTLTTSGSYTFTIRATNNGTYADRQFFKIVTYV